MEQELLKNSYLTLPPSQFTCAPFALNINRDSGRTRCDSIDSTKNTSGISSLTTVGHDTMRQNNPFFGNHNNQTYHSSQQTTPKMYNSCMPIQMRSQNFKLNTTLGHQQNNSPMQMFEANEQSGCISTNEYDRKNENDYELLSPNAMMTSDDDVSESSKHSNTKDSAQKKCSKNSKSGKATASLLSTTEKCRVCLAQAARHVHYGATTCYSCKAFFRRSIQLGAAFKYTCQTQGHCVMLPNTRKSCQRCRFDRCLSIGMKPDKVLTEKQRAKRFRKVRQKGADVPKFEVTSTSEPEDIRRSFTNPPADIPGQLDSESKEKKSPGVNVYTEFRGPSQSSFLEDWFFDSENNSKENERNYNPRSNERQLEFSPNILRNNETARGKTQTAAMEISDNQIETDKDAINCDQFCIKTEPVEIENDRSSLLDIDHSPPSTLHKTSSSNMISKIPVKDEIYDSCPFTNFIRAEKDDFGTQEHEFPYEGMNKKFCNRSFQEESNLTKLSSTRSSLNDYRNTTGEGESAFSIGSSSLFAKQPIGMEKYPFISSAICSTFTSTVKENNYATRRYPIEAGFGPSTSRGKPNDESTCTTFTCATTSVVPVSSIIPISHSGNQQVIFLIISN